MRRSLFRVETWLNVRLGSNVRLGLGGRSD